MGRSKKGYGVWGIGLVAAATLGTVGCHDDASDAEQGCLDVADAVAKAAERCNLGTYKDNYDAFVRTGAGGSCRNVKSLRDQSALYDECIPSFTTIDCTALADGQLDASCTKQLEQ